MTDSTALTIQQPEVSAPGALSFLHDGAAFEHLWRVAKAFSLSGMVPAHFQGKPESCMVALMYAQQLGEHPMVMFQEVTVINGRPGTSARFAISRANKSGLLAGPITWQTKGQGETLQVTARAVFAATGEAVDVTVTMREAVADGWARNPKYKSIPEQMLRWRSATRLINLYMPEVLFGLGVKEEIEQVAVRDIPQSGNSGSVIAELNQQIQATNAPTKSLDADPVDVVDELTTTEASPDETEFAPAQDDPFA
jgi:hypothetical protein